MHVIVFVMNGEWIIDELKPKEMHMTFKMLSFKSMGHQVIKPHLKME